MSIRTKSVLFLLFVLIGNWACAQNIDFGKNNYIEYQHGNFPLIISVAHGGTTEPSSIPDRACNDPVYAVDAFTIETALEIKKSIYAKTGCYPHIIISHLKRNKLDPNRNELDGACGNQEAIVAWQEFHYFIAKARRTANQEYNYNTFFVDLHGHSNPIERVELGYLLYDDELQFSDNILNTEKYINYSSIKRLANGNFNNYTHTELLKGPDAFGTLLSHRNFPAVPSQSIPFPGTNSNYFSGGYITANHTSYNPDAPINGLQMELNFNNIRNTATNRTKFAAAFADATIEYMKTHFNLNWNSCKPLSTINSQPTPQFSVYPNPVCRGDFIYFNLTEDITYEYMIFNLQGQLSAKGILNSETSLNSEQFNTGFYFINIFNELNGTYITKKIIIY